MDDYVKILLVRLSDSAGRTAMIAGWLMALVAYLATADAIPLVLSTLGMGNTYLVYVAYSLGREREAFGGNIISIVVTAASYALSAYALIGNS